MPGAHNGMAALQAKAAGFEALYLSGAAMTASMGLPGPRHDHGRRGLLLRPPGQPGSGLPVLVDGDTGYGEALNVMHMVRAFEDAGAAAVQIEDQILPKKCGHLNDKKLADAPIWRPRSPPRARPAGTCTSSPAPTPPPARAWTAPWPGPSCYMEAGADAIFPEALHDRRDVPRIRPAHARRAVARQHDRVRPHPVLHRRRVRGDGLPHGDLAGQRLRVANKAQESCMPRSAPTAAPRTRSTACRPAPSSTPPSTTPATKRSTPHREHRHPAGHAATHVTAGRGTRLYKRGGPFQTVRSNKGGPQWPRDIG